MPSAAAARRPGGRPDGSRQRHKPAPGGVRGAPGCGGAAAGGGSGRGRGGRRRPDTHGPGCGCGSQGHSRSPPPLPGRERLVTKGRTFFLFITSSVISKTPRSWARLPPPPACGASRARSFPPMKPKKPAATPTPGQKKAKSKGRGAAAAAATAVDLITSSARKRKPEQCSLVSPVRRRLCGGKLEEDSPQRRGPEEGKAASPHGGGNPARPSLLGSLFSPVLHLFKGIGAECSISCTSTVEQAHGCDDGSDDTGAVVVSNSYSKVAVASQDDWDDFDPYVFIRNLPDISQVVSPGRRLLLPRRTRRCPPVALVLDLDETLVHSTVDHCDDADFSFPVRSAFLEHTVYVRRRPHLQMFMEKVAQLFEIIVFTASQRVYAEQVLNILDPKRRLIRHRVYRDSCVYLDGNYLKDLSVLGRDLSKTVIIDNSPQAFGFQVDNGIPIESWFDDRSDCELASLLPFLESLASVEDVRPIIANKYKLRERIAAAAAARPPPDSRISLAQYAMSTQAR